MVSRDGGGDGNDMGNYVCFYQGPDKIWSVACRYSVLPFFIGIYLYLVFLSPCVTGQKLAGRTLRWG